MAVATRAMRPISALTAAAGDIATTRDPSRRIPEPESDDEVAELARTLDQMLRQLDAARSETEATVQRQREFVADASHELRTPLTSILANLELLDAALAADSRSDDDEGAAVASALRSSKRMNRLVGDLLLLARADAGRIGTRVECDLGTIASEALEEVAPVADGHRFSAVLDGSAPVSGNPDELHRMILNLLENAIRHTPEGTAIDVGLAIDGDTALLTVRDDGPGLPAGMEDQVFARFVRGEGPADRSARNGAGTGLGLSIVRAVATAHGGTVTAVNGPDGGAFFEVRMPLAAAAGDSESVIQV
jgi:signal transduction histidine kinase